MGGRQKELDIVSQVKKTRSKKRETVTKRSNLGKVPAARNPQAAGKTSKSRWEKTSQTFIKNPNIMVPVPGNTTISLTTNLSLSIGKSISFLSESTTPGRATRSNGLLSP